jgi:glycerol-1-phosphate dehydrogenase [NAD(P)+]
MVAPVPHGLKQLLGFSTECDCGRLHAVETRAVSIRKGALDDIVDLVFEIGAPLQVGIVSDRVTHEICGKRVEQLLKKAGHKVRVEIVPDGPGDRPHADQAGLTLVEDALGKCDLAVAVGSGTINDLTKLASFNRKIPYFSVATAPSMNGYTSAIAAMMIRQVKRTVECHQPWGVIADLDILCRAPQHLVAAGLGDLESKPTCTADFRLGGMLKETYYCSAPEQVVLGAESRAADAAEGIGRGDPEAIAALTEALILSGISMKLAGSSSPASGGEHLISHHWDMIAPDEGRVEFWHGSQVGVATIVTAALYASLAAMSPNDINIEAIIASRPSGDELEDEIRKRHGVRADEVMAEYFAKHPSDDGLEKELGYLVNNWDSLWKNLGEVLRPASRVRQILKAANAPVTMRSIGLTNKHLRKSFIAAREIRGRFTVLDLAADLGYLGKVRDQVLKASGCLD